MKKFEMIRAALDAQHVHELENARFYIEHGYYPTWAEDHRTDADRGLREHSTGTRWDAYTAGELPREKAVELAYKRAARELDKRHAARVGKVERAEAAPDLESVSISIEWVHSRTWGYNPHAEITVHAGGRWNQYTGTASGCGYDKKTAAVGAALNQCPSVLRMLYTAKENAFKDGRAVAGTVPGWSVYGGGNADAIHYGAGYGVLPYFEGGTGWSSFDGVFRACGYKCTVSHGGRASDFYIYEREEKRHE